MTTRPHRTGRRPARWLAVLLLTVVGTLGSAGQSAAHTDLTASDPADGATLSAAPSAISLTFNEPVQNFEPVVVLTGPDGQPYPIGTPIVDGATVSSDVQEVGPAGTYTIAYRVVSVDGHPVTGQLQFQLEAAADPVTTAPPAVESPNTPPSVVTSAITTAGPAEASPPTTSVPTTTSAAAQPVLPEKSTTVAPPELAVSSTDGSSGPSGWVWAALIGVVFLVAAVGVVIVRQRRQQRLGSH